MMLARYENTLHRLHREHLERLQRMGVRASPPSASSPPTPSSTPTPTPPSPPAPTPTRISLQHLPVFKRATFQSIKRVVCAHYGISHAALVAAGREHVQARHVAMFLMRTLIGSPIASFPRIARELGRTDHTTSFNGWRRTTDRAAGDPAFAQTLRDLGCRCQQEITRKRIEADG
jgi:hypothetical protein